jgi:hypothetical protein
MREVSDLEAEQVASSFRPNRKPWLIAIAANAVLALTLLGWPYMRGRSLALAMRHNFADLSRCLMGGEITKQPGLSLPQGDRDHFAAKVMLAGPDWPLSCRPALQRLAPEQAIFLWPSVKVAILDLRAAVELASNEVDSLNARRKAGLHRVPERVLQALRRVQAATVLLARAGGEEEEIDNDAIVWTGPPRLAAAARLPLMASDEAALDLYSTGTALEVLALDGRGVSYLRVADGKVDRERVRRTSFVRGAVRNGADAFLVWAMPDSRCAEREDRCASRPTGLAPYDKGAAALRDPLWKIGGHPAGRVDRVLQFTGSGGVLLLGRASAEGGATLMRFELPKDPPPPLAGEPAHSFDATESFDASAPAANLDVSFVRGAEPAAALALGTDVTDAAKLTASLTWADAKRKAPALPSVSGEHPWTLGCASLSGLTLAYGSDSELRVVSVPASTPTVAGSAPVAGTPAVAAVVAEPKELLSQTVALPGAIHGEDARLDRVRLICRENDAQVFWITRTLELWTSVCTGAEGCSTARSLANQVSSVAVLSVASGSVLALGNPADEVRVLRLDASGNPVAAPVAPSACFEPPSGVCGTPSLVADGQRVILTARDRSDLLALESTDGGKTFTTLSGFASAAMIEQSTTSPLQQHRKRKGIE